MIKPKEMSYAEARSYVEKVERDQLVTFKRVGGEYVDVKVSLGRDRSGEYVDVEGFTRVNHCVYVRMPRDNSFESESVE